MQRAAITSGLWRRPIAALAGFLLLTSALVFLPATPAFALVPDFTSPAGFDVGEGALVGTLVGDVDANDGDGGAADAGITYSILPNVNPDLDDAVAIDPATGELTVTDPTDFDFEGTDPAITVQADDGVDTPATQVVTLTVLDVPVYTDVGPFAVDENSAVATPIGDINANDGNGGADDAGITYSIVPGVDPDADSTDAVAIDLDSGELTVADTDDFDYEGTNQLIVTVVADDTVATTSVDVVINLNDLNDAPTLDAITNPAAILEDAGNQVVSLTGISVGAGEIQNILEVTASSSNTAIIPDPSVTYSANDATGSIDYTPVADASGTAIITVTVQDDGGVVGGGVDTVQQTFTVTVTEVNDAPTIDAVTNPAAVLEDATQQAVGLTGITTGGETQTLLVSATSSNPAVVPNPTVTYTSPDATGTLNWTPVANASGSALITVTVSDGGGTDNGGVEATTTDFTVTVTSVNDAPTIDAIDDPASINEGAGEQTIGLAGITAGPGESQNLTVTATSGNPSLIPDPTVTYTPNNATGSLAYTPLPGQSGSALITVTVGDDGGTANGGLNSNIETFTVNVTAVDGSPIFTAFGPFGVSEAAPVSTFIGNVDANDGDGGVADAGITYSITANQNPDDDGVPAVVINSTTGELSIADPDDFDFEGTNPLVVTVQADDSVLQTTQDVTINVVDANDAPVVTAIANQTIDEGSLFNGTVATFTDQDVADGHTATIDWGDLTAVDPVDPATSPITGSHTFVDNGVYTVTIDVSDGTDTASATFTMTVNNVAPVVEAFAGDTLYAGSSYTASGSFTDAGTNDTHTATVDWGEGGGTVPLTIGIGNTFNLNHTYAAAGGYTVEVCVTDGTDQGCNTATVTVVDPPTVTFGAATSSPGEAAGTHTVGVRLNAPAGGTLDEVQVTVVDDLSGSADTPDDYTFATQVVTFPNGSATNTQTVSVGIEQDGIAEGNETIDLSLSVTSGTADPGALTAHEVTIVDDEGTPTVSIADGSITEGGTLSIPVTLSSASGGDVTVSFTVTGVTATVGVDYTNPPLSVTVPAGLTSASIDIATLQDTTDEVDETLTVALTSVTAGTANIAAPPGDEATGTILDNDAEPTLSLDTPTAAEGDTSLVFTITLSAPSGKTVTVTAETTELGSATPGLDFSAVGPTDRTFTPGQTTKTVAVPIIDDTLDEPTEDVQMTLIASTNAGIDVGTRRGDITDDDPPVGISVENTSVTEGDAGTQTMTFDVVLSAASGHTVTVDVETSDISATAGLDYVAVTTTQLVFVPGVTSLPVNVTVNGDVVAEDNETFELLLSNAVEATITTPSATGTILDNEGPPTVDIAPATVTEAVGAQLEYLVTLSGASSETITVTWAATAGSATVGVDFVAASGTLTYPAGATNRFARVTVIDDALDEFDETVTVTLTGITAGDATLGTAVAIGTIEDDEDPPSLSLNVPTVAEDEGPLVFTITLSEESAKTVTVTAATTNGGSATPGTDFVPVSTTVTFNPGQTSKTVAVTITDDTLDEPQETVQLTLTDPTNATINIGTRAGTITDNDPQVEVSVAGATVGEAAGLVNVLISLSAVSGRNVRITATTLPGSATAPADYTATSQDFTFAPGETTKTLVVPIVDDVIDENNETFTVTLTDPSLVDIGTGTATITITDNDTAGITVTPTALTVAEGASGVPYSVVLLTEPLANVVVGVSLPGGEATASPTSLTFTPANWNQARDVTVTAVNDAVFDGTKTATVSHTVNSGDLKYDGITAAPVAVTVIDDEDTPTISISDAGVAELDAAPVAMTFDLSVSPASTSDITVDYVTTAGSATANVDYTQVPLTQLLIPAGATTATISVDVLPDNLAEPAETFTVTLTNPGGGAGIGTSLATGTITDDDDAPNGVADNYTVDEGGVLSTFNVLANDVDDDDTALTATVVDAPAHAAVFSLAPDGNLTYEHDGSEMPTDSFTYRVSDGTNTSGATTVTITVTPVNDVPVVDAGGNLTVDEGDLVALPPATFTDPDPGDTHIATIDWGDDSPLATGTVDEGAGTVDASHVYADNGTFSVAVDVVDSAVPPGQGGATFDVSVANVAPTAVVAGAPASSPEGTPISLTATADDPGTADTHSFAWSVTKDGSAYASGATATIDFTPDDEGSYVLTAIATDDDGAASAPVSVTIAVTNVAPTVTPPADPTINEGSSVSTTANIADPGTLDTFTATVDWGEGAGPEAVTAGTDVPLVHQYIEDGVYTVTVCVDDGTDETCEVITVTVQNRPATITAATATPPTITEGDTVTLDVTFTDPGTTDTHTAVVNWGDGTDTTTVDPATSPFQLTHTYVDEGTEGSFAIDITITDDDGGVDITTDEVVVTVQNSALLVDAGSEGESIFEGDSVSFSVAIDDAGITDTHSAVIAWGDGTPNTVLAADIGRTFDTGSHLYAQDGTYNVLITVTDNGGDVGTTSIPVVVANVAPVAAALTPTTIDEGTTFVSSGTFTDPGADDTFTGTVNYGDGTPLESLAVGAGTFDLDHLYADDGVFTVTVCITDEADDTGCAAANVTVNNVNPTASVSGPVTPLPPFLEGGLLDFTASASDVPADPLTYAWSVERGDETVATGTGVNFSFTPDDNGLYSVSMVVSDGDGGSTLVSSPVTVINVAPTGQITKSGGGLPLTTRNEGSSVELTASVTDPGADTFTYAWSVTKNGSPFTTGTTKDFTFVPDDEGLFSVSLVVTDDDGDSTDTLSYDLTALNVKPAPTILGTTGAVEGELVTLSADVNDPGPLDVAVYTWEVRLQGQLFASGSAPTLSFRPADNGVYFVSVVVSDDDPADPTDDAVSGIGAQAVLVTVANAAPVITSLNTNTAPQFGASVPLTVNFTDSGTADLHTGQVDWGDGSPPADLVITESNGSGTATASHTFANRGSYTAEVCISDDDLGEVCQTIVYAAGAILNLSSDYNGDGRDDLAIGVPGESVSGASRAGAVNVLFGRRIGIGSGPDDFLHQDSSGVPSLAQKNDEFGSAIASGDFNGDGFSDLAVSSRGESLGGSARTGSVTVFNGSAAGISRSNVQWWHQGLSGIPGSHGTRDYFGATLATGDFNGDNFADLAIGVTGEDVGTATDAGRVVVLYGSPLGLTAPADSWDQDSPGVKNVAQPGDTFGASLTAGDFDGDGFYDLAIGVPLEDVQGQINAGAVNVLRGSVSGLISRNDVFLHQDTNGVNNKAEPNDNFGAAVAAGDFNGDGFVDLAVGIPGESYGGTRRAGAVAVLRGSATGLSGVKDQLFVAGNSNLPGTARANANFGASLAAADFTGNGRSDLAIGTPGDLVAGKNKAGSVTHLKGIATGLTVKRAKRFTESSPGLAGNPNGNDQFGATLRAGNFDGDNDWDLAVGIPNQNVGGSANAGAVLVLRSRRTGITTQADTLWNQNTSGVKDVAEAGDGFGRGL